jgi:hypothetical protein
MREVPAGGEGGVAGSLMLQATVFTAGFCVGRVLRTTVKVDAGCEVSLQQPVCRETDLKAVKGHENGSRTQTRQHPPYTPYLVSVNKVLTKCGGGRREGSSKKW